MHLINVDALDLGSAVWGALLAVYATLHCGEMVKAPILALFVAVEVANAKDCFTSTTFIVIATASELRKSKSTLIQQHRRDLLPIRLCLLFPRNTQDLHCHWSLLTSTLVMTSTSAFDFPSSWCVTQSGQDRRIPSAISDKKKKLKLSQQHSASTAGDDIGKSSDCTKKSKRMYDEYRAVRAIPLHPL